MDSNTLPMSPSSSTYSGDSAVKKSRYKKLKKSNQLEMHVCAVCGTSKNLLRCSRCKITYYCGTLHQHMDWPKHKIQCNKQSQQLVAEFSENWNGIQLSSPPNIVSNTLITTAATTENSQITVTTSLTDLYQENVLSCASREASILSSQSPLESSTPSSLDLLNENKMPFSEEVEALIEPMNDMSSNFSSLIEQIYSTTTIPTTTTTTFTTGTKLSTSTMCSNVETVDYNDCNDVALSTLQQFQNYRNNDLFAQQQQQHQHEYQQFNWQQQPQDAQQHQQFISPTNNHSKSVEYLPNSQFSTHAINQREKSTSHQIDANITNGLLLESFNDRRYEELCRNITNDMNEYGLSVVDDFLGTEKGLQILNEVHRMYAAGVFKDGQLVNKVKSEQDLRTIRGDKITWVKGVELGCSNIGYLINQIDAVICRANTMNNNGKLGDYIIRERTKAMVACYPGSGAHYVMHVDNPNKDGRVITAIYYLNINWDAERSGGVLRIFPEQAQSVADIEPKFDRLIFFWSDKRNPHEVQPAHRTRYAITVWYFDANEREAALNRCKNLTSNNNIMYGQF